jgi:hypothetical protein
MFTRPYLLDLLERGINAGAAAFLAVLLPPVSGTTLLGLAAAGTAALVEILRGLAAGRVPDSSVHPGTADASLLSRQTRAIDPGARTIEPEG